MKEEVLLISFPKSGRTWLTMVLARIFQQEYHLKEKEVINIERISKKIEKLPKIRVIHENSPQKKRAQDLSKIKSKYKNKKIIFLVRDPRDVIVSLFFHEKRRKKRYNGELSDFILRGVGDFDTIIQYYNIWADNRNKLNNFLIIRYEDLKKDLKKQLKKIINFIGVGGIKKKNINEAIKFASFKNMQKMEKENKFSVNRLKPRDINDPESFKIRRGKIGGYRDYLTKEEITILNKKMIKLSKIYRYLPY